MGYPEWPATVGGMGLPISGDDLVLSGSFNVRDVGGLPTADGRSVRPGMLLRSAHLGDLDDDGRAALTDLGVDEVIDLRAPAECDAEGYDALPGHVRGRLLPFAVDRSSFSARGMSADAVRGHMSDIYRTYPGLSGASAAILAIVESIADGRSVLVHCAAGKDRTGWAVASVLRAAGVPETAVHADYLRSNDAVDHLRQMVIRRHPDAESIPVDYLGVHVDYLRSADAAMAATHGDTAGYLAACGIGPDLMTRFAERFVG